MKVRKSIVEFEVNRILESRESKDIPVNIEHVCSSLGFKYEESDLEESVSGAAVVDGDKKIVLVNENHHENRKRFTGAHEIGHLVLHRNMSLNIDKDTPTTLFRDSRSSQGFDWREQEANYFAACLLMPENLLRNRVDKISNGLITEFDIAKLADEFEVSEQAMCIRLSYLGYISY